MNICPLQVQKGLKPDICGNDIPTHSTDDILEKVEATH